MSIANLKDQGNQGNNMPYQLRNLQLLGQILTAINSSAGNDREMRTTVYQAIANGLGYSIGDLVSRTDIINVTTGTIVLTLWFNETTGATLTFPPLPADLVLFTPGAYTPVQRTPSLARVTIPGTVAAGARSVSVYNAGLANGVWLGAVIKPGEQFNYDAASIADTLKAFPYDGTGTELVITTVV
jgi:hypothetical protein